MRKRIHNGYVVLLVLMVISVILLLAMSIVDISSNEIRFSGFGSESMRAFYAADSAVECAFYWDLPPQDAFSGANYAINCNNTPINGSVIAGIAQFDIVFSNGTCARTTVDKSAPPATVIIASGYNLDCNSTSELKIERGIRLDY
ncbi:MAG: hypothetical protein AB1643_03125 [Patescibacteria group bacterium]